MTAVANKRAPRKTPAPAARAVPLPMDAAAREEPTWLTCPAEGAPPMTVTPLSSAPAAAKERAEEQRVISTLADILQKLSGQEKRAPARKRKAERNASLVVKALSPPAQPKRPRHRVPLCSWGLRAVKPDWALFQKRVGPFPEAKLSSADAAATAKKRPLRDKNPSLEVKALSPYADPDAPGARTLVVTEANSCNSDSSYVFRAPGRYKTLIISKKRKVASKPSKMGRSSKSKARDILSRDPPGAKEAKE